MVVIPPLLAKVVIPATFRLPETSANELTSRLDVIVAIPPTAKLPATSANELASIAPVNVLIPSALKLAVEVTPRIVISL